MDERDFEDRLNRRLHARFDTGAASPALRNRVAQTLTRDVPRARRTSWRAPALAAAVVIVFAAVAMASRFATSPAMLPGSSMASPTASPTIGPSATPSALSTSTPPTSTPAPTTPTQSGTVPPVSTATWTGLNVHALAGGPITVSMMIPWSGGYVAMAQSGVTVAQSAWFSRDGRSWIPLPAATFGLNDTNLYVSAGSRCRDGVIVATYATSGAHKLWYSSDGTTWVDPTIAATPTVLAGNSTGAVAADETGLEFTSDCSTWRKVALPGRADVHVDAVAAFGSGFVAAGWAGPFDGGPSVEPVAWWSADGQNWTAATIAGTGGNGFTDIEAGSSGLLGIMTGIGSTGSPSYLWTSADGRSWKPVPAGGPLGLQYTGAGQGSPNGEFAGDGSRLQVFGSAIFAGTDPNQIYVSTDGTHWSKLAVTGDGAAASTAPDGQITAFLMRDGIFFSGPTGAWFGDATP